MLLMVLLMGAGFGSSAWAQDCFYKLALRPVLGESDPGTLYTINRKAKRYPWSEDHFAEELNKKGGVGLLAVSEDGEAMGYVILRPPTRLRLEAEILNFAVAPEHQRKGAGTALFNELRWRMEHYRWQKIKIRVPLMDSATPRFLLERGYNEVTIPNPYERVFELTPMNTAHGRRANPVEVADGFVADFGTIRKLSPEELDRLMNQLTHGE